MAMDDKLTGNSYKSKIKEPEKKVVDKVVSGKVKRRKGSKLSSFLISEDAGQVKSYILLDVLIPSLKKAIYDIITSGIEIILYGESGKNRSKTNATKVSYASYYDGSSRSQSYSYDPFKHSYSYDDIIIDQRGDAEEVLYKMDELISMYGVASIADFYDLVGITGNFTDNKYGWRDLRSAQVVRVRDGYCIKFPKVEPIN